MAGGRLLVAALAGVGLALAGAQAAGESAAHRLVGSTGSSAMPAWTPDGAGLVFHSRRKDERQRGVATRNIWSIGADGTGERRLTKGNKDEYHAALSPDGRKLLYVSEVNGSRDIWIADADGQNAVPLTDDPGTEDQPAWAPDSRQIVYAAFPKEGGSFDLWLVNVDGSGRRRLTTTPANEIFPAWHPNGEDIVYVTDASGNFDLYTINIRDGRTRPLVTSPDHEARPAWAPDGTKLAFSRWPARGRSTDATLWIANADGSGAIELKDAPAPATHPAWAPDGRTLAFQHRGEAGWEIWALALPVEVVGARRLRAGQQPAAGVDVDVVRLQGGETLRGRLQETQFRVRTAYGAVDLSRSAVASVLFDTGERGLARVVLANGDTLTGLLEAEAVHLTTGAHTQGLAVERIAQLSLRPGRGAAEGSFRAVMRNGDSLLVTESFSPLRLHVGQRPTNVEAQRIDRVEFAEDGKKASVVLRNGDSLSGELASERLELGLAVGARLAVHPSAIRTLVRAAAPAPAARTGG